MLHRLIGAIILASLSLGCSFAFQGRLGSPDPPKPPITHGKEEPMPQVHKFHVKLTDGTERTITAGAADVQANGTLCFVREDSTEIKIMYAPEAWQYCETESQDDRGYPDAETLSPPKPLGGKRVS